MLQLLAFSVYLPGNCRRLNIGGLYCPYQVWFRIVNMYYFRCIFSIYIIAISMSFFISNYKFLLLVIWLCFSALVVSNIWWYLIFHTSSPQTLDLHPERKYCGLINITKIDLEAVVDSWLLISNLYWIKYYHFILFLDGLFERYIN